MAFLLMACTYQLSAQSETSPNSNTNFASSFFKSSEIGIRFRNANNFDFIFKKKRKENSFFRLRLISGNVVLLQSNDNNQSNLRLGLACGWEKRKSISDNLYFIHGFEPGFTFDFARNQGNSYQRVYPFLGYVLGLHYEITDRFSINMETIPSIQGRFYFDDFVLRDDFILSAGFNSNVINFTLAYKL